MTMMSGKIVYFNIICEEIGITGGKIIHIDKNVKNEEEMCSIFFNNVFKYPNAKWEIYPSLISIQA